MAVGSERGGHLVAAAAASLLVLAGIVVVIRNSKNEPVGKVSVPDNRPLKLTHDDEELATIEGKGDGSGPATEIELPLNKIPGQVLHHCQAIAGRGVRV